MRYSIGLSFVAALCFVSTALGEKNASLETKIASVGSPVIEQSFDAELAPPMSVAKGEWKVVEGTLVGKELAADKHAAVLNLQRPNRNSVVRFSFKLDGDTDGLNFSLNHAGGHLFRVVVASNKLSVNLDKDKKDPDSEAVVLGTAKGDFEQGKWYTMQIEMVGPRVVVQTDNGSMIEASHAKLDTDKPNYRFVMRGDSLAIDDLHVWDVN